MLISRQIKRIIFKRPIMFSFSKLGNGSDIRKSSMGNLNIHQLCNQLNIYLAHKCSAYVSLYMSYLIFRKITLDSVLPSLLSIRDWLFSTLQMEQHFNFVSLKFQTLKFEISIFVFSENCHLTTASGVGNTKLMFILWWVLIILT